MHVEANAGPRLALVGTMGDGPSHVGGYGEERSVNGQHLAQRLGQIGRRWPQSLRHRGRLQAFNNRRQQSRIGDAVKIGEGAFAKTADGQMPLCLSRLAEIFDRPKTPQGGIEEGQQMCDYNVVEKQLAIAVGIGIPQCPHMFLQHPHILAAGDGFRPTWQRFEGCFFGHARILRDLGRGRKMDY